MIVLPAIDIRKGKCVRLQQGLFDQETSYYEDPVYVAKMWEEKGAKYLHIVDLDGAQQGVGANFSILKSIINSISIPVEIGGGIRSLVAVKSYLDIGVDRVILGTKAIEDLDFIQGLCSDYGDKIAVSVDAKGDYVAIKGWVETSTIKTLPFCQDLVGAGVRTIIYTDISRDGMLTGPNLQMLKRLKDALDVHIIASGGVASIKNLQDLMKLDLYGAIVGKALYEGTLTMDEIRLLEQKGM